MGYVAISLIALIPINEPRDGNIISQAIQNTASTHNLHLLTEDILGLGWKFEGHNIHIEDIQKAFAEVANRYGLTLHIFYVEVGVPAVIYVGPGAKEEAAAAIARLTMTREDYITQLVYDLQHPDDDAYPSFGWDVPTFLLHAESVAALHHVNAWQEAAQEAFERYYHVDDPA